MSSNPEDFQGKKKTRNQLFKNLSRLLISIIAFICLIKFGKVDIKVAVKYLLQVNPLYFSLAYLSYLITMFIAGLRFYFSSHILGFKKSYPQLIQLNFVGTFFNNFLPTTFGGDALRGYYLKRGSNIPLSKAAACIVYERYTGMIVLFWAASFAFILQGLGIISKTAWHVPKQLIIFSHLCTVITIFVIPFLPQINNLFFGKTNWIQKKIIEPVIVYWQDLSLTIRISLLSVILQTCVTISHFFIAKSLNIDIPLSYYLVFYPLTTIAGFLIPSLNGLGIREGAYIYFLKKVGIGTDQGLAFSICWLIILLITSVIGGFVYLLGDFRKNKHVQN